MSLPFEDESLVTGVEKGVQPSRPAEVAREMDITISKLKDLREYRGREPISTNIKLGDDKETEFGD